MAASGPKIVVILGPTASGKSALAMAVARRMGGEILSVDSMQVYRGMDIGTAKPSPTERAAIPHHLIDVADPDESFAVSRFVELADATIADAARRGVPIIATGGTPLYYKSLFEGLFQGPGADATVRSRLQEEPLQTLHERLQSLDPPAALRIHVNDRRRLVRALEVHELTGKPISSFQTAWASQAMRHEAEWFGLNWEKDALSRRINSRVKMMIEQGWLDEARPLLHRHHGLSQTAAEATGYQELFEHLRGNLTLDDAVELIKIATRQLARRQMKWFRRFRRVRWLDGSAPPDELVNAVVAPAPPAAP